MTITPEQLTTIRQQLGREPRGMVAIAASSANGVPLVLQVRSLVDDQPFPTLYWLCSKDLHKAISRIEGRGWIKHIEARLRQEPDLADRYKQDHQRYIAHRWQAMHPDDKQRIEARELTSLFDQYGIGGISKWHNVRCLHMQYAHHLAAGNCIGQIMDDEFGLQEITIKQ
ncbi:MAG: hypothetical protein ACJAYG_001446 [Oceanicoccus sp.]|jgi:hypothetical protein